MAVSAFIDGEVRDPRQDERDADDDDMDRRAPYMHRLMRSDIEVWDDDLGESL